MIDIFSRKMLSSNLYTFTISPIPSNATIYMTYHGQTEMTNKVRVPYGTTVSYRLTAEGYFDYEGSVRITADRNLQAILTPKTRSGSVASSRYQSNYTVADVTSFSAYKAGVYRVTLKGEQAFCEVHTPSGWTYPRYGKGGIVVCDFNLEQGQNLKIKKIRGGLFWKYDYDANSPRFGGLGLAFYLDNDLKLIAGGGGGYDYVRSGSTTTYYTLGGGGNEGGSGNTYGEYQGSGYSITGELGHNTSLVPNNPQGENYIVSNRTCYGGTGYIKTGLNPSQISYGANEGNAYYEIKYIE